MKSADKLRKEWEHLVHNKLSAKDGAKVLNYLNEDIQADVKIVKEGRDTLTKKECLDLWRKHSDNCMMHYHLMGCRNMDTDVIKEYIKNSCAEPILYTDVNTRNHIFAAKFPQKTLDAIIEELSILCASKGGKYSMRRAKSNTLLSVVEYVYKNPHLTVAIPRFSSMAQLFRDAFALIKPDDTLTQGEIQERINNLLELDISVYEKEYKASKYNIEDAKMFLRDAIICCPSLDDDFKEKVYYDEMATCHFETSLTPAMARDVYESIMYTADILDNESEGIDEADKLRMESEITDAFKILCRNVSFTHDMEYDFAQRAMATAENSAVMQSLINIYVLYRHREGLHLHIKGNETALKIVIDTQKKGELKNLMFNMAVSDDVKRLAADRYIELTKNNTLKKTNRGIYGTYIGMMGIRPLTEEIYTSVMALQDPLSLGAEFQNLQAAIPEYCHSPRVIIEKAMKEQPNDENIFTALCCNKILETHPITAPQFFALKTALERNYTSGKGGLLKHLTAFETMVLKGCDTWIDEFFAKAQQWSGGNEKERGIRDRYIKNVAAMEKLYKIYREYNFNRNEVLKAEFPQQYYREQIALLLDKTTQGEDGMSDLLINIAEKIDEYEEEFIELVKIKNQKPKGLLTEIENSANNKAEDILDCEHENR